jgi:hypothetical protein
MKKIIVVLAAGLVGLIVVTTVITQAFLKGGSSGTPTPTPRPSRTGTGNFFQQNKLKPTLSPAERDRRFLGIAQKAWDSLTAAQKAALKKLQSKLPSQTDDFEMRYSPELNRFFVSIKTPAGYEKLKDFLAENGLLDVYEQGHGAIIFGEEPVDTLISDTRNRILDAVESGYYNPDTNRRPPTARDWTILEEKIPSMPIDTPDFSIDVIKTPNQPDKFVITKNTENADSALSSWLSENGLGGVDYMDYTQSQNNTFIVVDSPHENLPSSSSQNKTPDNPKNQKLLTDLLRVLLEFDTGEPPQDTTSPNGTPPEKVDTFAADAILNNPRIQLTSNARSDLLTSHIDKRLINLLGNIAKRHKIYISYFYYRNLAYRGGPHMEGKAVDIVLVDGARVSPSNSRARALIEYAITYPNAQDRANEFGIPARWSDLQSQYDRPGFNIFARWDHDNHLHIGYTN